MQISNLKIGDRLLWIAEDFDSPYEEISCTVWIVENDHAIARTEDNINLWIDIDTIKDFKR